MALIAVTVLSFLVLGKPAVVILVSLTVVSMDSDLLQRNKSSVCSKRFLQEALSIEELPNIF